MVPKNLKWRFLCKNRINPNFTMLYFHLTNMVGWIIEKRELNETLIISLVENVCAQTTICTSLSFQSSMSLLFCCECGDWTVTLNIWYLKNLVWHSHNFLLPCITVEKCFITSITFIFNLYFLCFVVDELPALNNF